MKFFLIFLCILQWIDAKMLLKWGIAGAGKISHDFVVAVQTYPADDHKFVAVAARSKANAEKFASELNISKSYEGYQALAKDQDVDIVYVGNLNTQHFETVKVMLENGKHVLCEKPMAINEKQTAKLIEIAKEKKLLLLQAVWSRHFPAYQEMKKLIKEGAIGDVNYVSVSFGLPLQGVNRVVTKELGGGAILDIGIYTLQFQQYVFEGLNPIKVVGNGHLNENKVDESCGAVITYPDSKLAVVSTSAKVQLPNEAIVVGTNGTLKLPMFWCPTQLITPNGTKEWSLPKAAKPFNYNNSVGLRYQAEHARQLLIEGKIESDIVSHKDSIELAKLMDLLRKEVGNEYPEDLLEY